MITAIYPGSFDPVTKGHVDVIERSLGMFEKVVVAVMSNSSKNPAFSQEERIQLIQTSIRELGIDPEKMSRLEVVAHSGLLVDFAKSLGASVIVKGLRAVSDFEYEFQMAAVNQKLDDDIDSVFVMTRTEYMYISSSIVKEVARYGGDISTFVSPSVAKAMLERMGVK